MSIVYTFHMNKILLLLSRILSYKSKLTPVFVLKKHTCEKDIINSSMYFVKADFGLSKYLFHRNFQDFPQQLLQLTSNEN